MLHLTSDRLLLVGHAVLISALPRVNGCVNDVASNPEAGGLGLREEQLENCYNAQSVVDLLIPG